MPGLFGGSLFGQQAPTQGLDSSQAQSLGIIQAMQQSQQAGMQRTASPIGSIAQNLMPLFSAMIYAKAADKQAQAEAAQAEQDQLSAKLKNALMASLIQKNEQPQQSNLQQEMERAAEWRPSEAPGSHRHSESHSEAFCGLRLLVAPSG